MSWVAIPDDLPWRPELLVAGPGAAELVFGAWCYCSRNLTDGFIPALMVSSLALRLVDAEAVAARLVDAGIWQAVPGGYRIPGFLDINRTRAEVERVRRLQIEGGKLGAARRWSDDKPDGSTHESTHGSTDGSPMGPTQWVTQCSPAPAPAPAPHRTEEEDIGNGAASTADAAPVYSSLDSLEPGTTAAEAPPAPGTSRAGSDGAPQVDGNREPAPSPLSPDLAARANRIGALVGEMATANARKRPTAHGVRVPQGVRYEPKTNRLIVPTGARALYRKAFPEFDVAGEIAMAQRHLDTLKARGERLRHQDGTPVADRDIPQWFTNRLRWQRDSPFDPNNGAKLEYDVESGEYVP